MAFNVQSDAGDVVAANAYVDLDSFKSYHVDRGNSLSAYVDSQLQAAVVRASDFVDQRFQYIGTRLTKTQLTEWPRRAGSEILLPWFNADVLMPVSNPFDVGPEGFVAIVDASGNDVLGVPDAIKRATCEYGLRALKAPLFQDAPAPAGGRLIQTESIEVDIIKKSRTYFPGQAGGFAMPAYPPADLIITRAGLVFPFRTLIR